VKGVSHPLMTYEVVDSFKNIRKNQDAAESVMAGFSVYFDRELMNEEQKGDILKKLDEIKQQVENTLFLDQLDLEL
jgi:LytS/YehU family sensor histidine kinase